eukprot:CAMPEP_0174259640 /NCGR_PEP_ID=MMETSP0439-20130205/8451_1 /TAXON_ID=0 /ORGANISM="Stereomyxa ramosa, Strain Chinc5" /LENGTH=469 /DNA_ID=CAMNT_0015343615 /DNA_START=63 /DNA_END=1472 /DNA_ORIENTATION=+
MEEIGEASGVTLSQTKNALYVLIQQNLVAFVTHFVEKKSDSTAFVEDKPEETVLITHYHALVDNILYRIRFPKIVLTTREIYGDEAAIIVQILLEHGRLTKQQALTHAAHSVGVPELDDSALKKLIRKRFVVKVGVTPPPQPVPSINQEKVKNPNAKAKKARPRASNLAQAYRSLPNSNNKRKAMDICNERNPRQKLDTDDEESYWCISYLAFNHYYREQSIIKLALEKIDQNAGLIMKALMKLSTYSSDDDTSSPVTLPRLHEQLVTKENADISLEVLKKYLELMETDAARFVKKAVADTDTTVCTYVINVTSVGNLLREKLIESIVEKKFGKHALRIFRILLIKKQLEEKQVAELALITLKDTRELLYKLFTANFILLQEVPKSSDYAPSRTFYFWSVKLDQLRKQIREHIYKIMFNLRLRLRKELQRDPALGRKQQLNDEDLQHIADHLENSILSLDNDMMIINDF